MIGSHVVETGRSCVLYGRRSHVRGRGCGCWTVCGCHVNRVQGSQHWHTATMKTSLGVPKFLTKIWALVEDPRNSDYICWSQDGDSFIVLNEESFAKEILPRHFKHNNMASFVRQLNWYGFHKVLADDGSASRHDKYCSGRYQHPYFKRGQEELLIKIKRKVTGDKRTFQKTTQKISVPRIEDAKSAPNDMQKIMMVLHQLQARQDILDSTVESLKRENEALWKEVLQLRPLQPQFEPGETPHSYEPLSNQPLMIDSTGNYNQSAAKSSGNSDLASENRSQWFTHRKCDKGTRTCKEDLDSSFEDERNQLKISVTQDYETYQSGDSDDPSDSSSSESELVINEDPMSNHGQSYTKSPDVSLGHNWKHGSRKRRKTSADKHYIVKRKFIYGGCENENEDEQKSFHTDSGHPDDKTGKRCRSHCVKMEQMLKQMHQDHTRLTEKVLTAEQQSAQKLSEISTTLTTLTSFIMSTQNFQKSRLPLMGSSKKTK